MSTLTAMEQVSVHPAQVAELRPRGNELLLAITSAVDAAGLSEAESLAFDDGGSLVVAKGLVERVDGRSSRHAVRIQRGSGGQRQITLPKRDYDRLGIDVDADELPRILVYAGPQTLAFERADSVEKTVTRPVDGGD